jgi:hypothetical protein
LRDLLLPASPALVSSPIATFLVLNLSQEGVATVLRTQKELAEQLSLRMSNGR